MPKTLPRLLLLSACAVPLAFAGAAHAQTMPVPAGVLSLSAQASTEVPQDTVDITMFYEQDGQEPGALSAELNRRATAALDEARSGGAVSARTGQFAVTPNTDRDGKLTGWRGRVEIVLESHDFNAAAKLAGKLGASLQIGGVNYSLSPEAERTAEQKLGAQAIAAFRARAEDAARAFGYGGYTIREVNLSGGNGARPMPRMMMMAAAPSAAPVAVSGGTATVTVTVNGSVQMR